MVDPRRDPCPSVGRFRGRPRGHLVSVRGEFQWPPMGSFAWPPSAGFSSSPADPPKVRQQVIQLLSSYQDSVSQPTSISRNLDPRLPLDALQDTFTERVGKDWTVRVVRVGRTPPDYEAAYDELEEMLESVDVAVDDRVVTRVFVRSVDTDEGPGLELTFKQRVEDKPVNDIDAGGPRL